jgi:hypothetical protein
MGLWSFPASLIVDSSTHLKFVKFNKNLNGKRVGGEKVMRYKANTFFQHGWVVIYKDLAHGW